MKTMENKQLISVVLPMFNTEKYITDAIDSILLQTYPVFEIIVVDDGSTDASAEAAKSYGSKITYLYQSNKGSAAARNTGVRAATGDFFAFLDGDDLWTNDKIMLQLDMFNSLADLDIVFGNVEQFFSPEIDQSAKTQLKAELTRMPGYHVGTMLIKKEAFYKVGFFNEKYELAEFIDWFDRARLLNLKYTMLTDVLMKRRIHATNQGICKREHRKDYITVLKAAIDRKRRRGNL